MFSGFVSSKYVIDAIGVHQRFNAAAYRLVLPYLSTGSSFPRLKQIQHFEGLNGPDGLKVKSPGVAEPTQLYDPITDQGEVPMHIGNHYQRLVESLRAGDRIRASFEASWVAHFITDGLTPAHHYPLHERLAEIKGVEGAYKPDTFLSKGLHVDESLLSTLRINWAIWGKKGELSTHLNFEMGVATALVGHRLHVRLDESELANARKLGPVEYFKQQARDISSLGLYERFYETGWNNEMATVVRNRLAPQTAQTIGIIWLLAYLEAGFSSASAKHAANSKAT